MRRYHLAILALLALFAIGQLAGPAFGLELWRLVDPYSNGNNIVELDASGTNDQSMTWYNDGSATVTMDIDSGNITLTGDIAAAGGFKMPLTYAHAEVGTSLSSHAPMAGAIQLGSGATDSTYVYEYPMPWAGSVMGVSIVSSQAVTSGSAHVEVVTGTCGDVSAQSGTGLTVALHDAGGQTQHNTSTQAKGTDTFTAGQCVLAHMATSSGFAPVQADLTTVIYVEQ